MSKKHWIIGGFAVLFFILILVYFFFPSESNYSGKRYSEKKISFLDANPQWADSLIKSMSLEEKAAMLIMYEPRVSANSDSVFNAKIVPGAYFLSIENILNKTEKSKFEKSLVIANFDQIPVLNKKNETNDSFLKSIYGNDEIFFSVTNDSILNESYNLITKASDFHAIDGVILPCSGMKNTNEITNQIFKSDTAKFLKSILSLGDILVSSNFLTSASVLSEFHKAGPKSTLADSLFSANKKIAKQQFPVFLIDSNFSVKNLEKSEISNYLKKEFQFNGITIALSAKNENMNSKKIKTLLDSGVDLIHTRNFSLTHFTLMELIHKGELKENFINEKVKKTLLAKTWSKMKRKRANYKKPETFNALEKSFSRRLRKASIVLIRNEKNSIPIKNILNNKIAVIHLGHQAKSFVRNIYYYLPDEQTVPVKTIDKFSDYKKLNVNDYKKYQTVILTIHGEIKNELPLLEMLTQLSKSTKLIIVNFKFPQNLLYLHTFPAAIQCLDNSTIEIEFSAQAIFGGLSFSARQPIFFSNRLKLNKSISLPQSRLQYTIPEDIGIASDSLSKISYIVEEGIRNKAFPGAQVFFALEGKVFYNRSFGTHIYNDKQEVKTTDLFDMASVTKVASSTIVAMSTYEKGMFKLDDSLYKHIPDTLKKHINGKSTLRNITFRQILIHATGLAAGQPILKYIRYRDSLIDRSSRFDKYYCDYSDDYYKIKVAEDFYMEREQADTIWYAMNRMSVDENPSYRYSDANMNLLYKLLDAKIKNRWRFYLDSLFYKPLGMFNTYYLPLENKIKPERIVPTENDRYWRKQLLRGYVHDPTAALFGGVAGNAGLFSTAEDIGILFQMLMYKGSYGGINYFKRETVDLFISQQPGSHRGLGFNRQVKGNTYGVSPYASKNTFGHTGFTGISVWADMDIKLLYVSCTNRVHPDAENKKIINLGTTKRIHNVIYEQLKYVMPDKINLAK